MSTNWREDWEDVLKILVPTIISAPLLIKIIKKLNTVQTEDELVKILKENLNESRIKNLKKYPEIRGNDTEEVLMIKKCASSLYIMRKKNNYKYKKILSKIEILLSKNIFDAITYEIACMTTNSNKGFVKFNKKYNFEVLIMAEKKFIEQIELNNNSPTEISNIITDFWKCVEQLLKNLYRRETKIKKFITNAAIKINNNVKHNTDLYLNLYSDKNLNEIFNRDFRKFTSEILNYGENYSLNKSGLSILKKIAFIFILNDFVKLGNKIYLLQHIRNNYGHEDKNFNLNRRKKDAEIVRTLTYDVINGLSTIF